MKLYIATTSLNFDTIMSTESISPVSFYALRKFGIPYIYDKVSLCLPNSILLFDFIPEYSINRQEYDHRALIIEIDTDFYPADYFKKVKDGIYQTDKTIYLSPASSKFFFLSHEDYTVTLNKSANIIETKSILYRKANRIAVARLQDCRKINRDVFADIKDTGQIDEDSLRRDKAINKAKGFLTGYMIGRGKSLTTESARLQNITRLIKNLIYALITNEGADKQRIYQNLKDLTKEASHLALILDEKQARALSCVTKDMADEGIDEDNIKMLCRYLSKRGVYSVLLNNICPGAKIFSYEQAVFAAARATDDKALEEQLKSLTDYTNSLLRYTETKADLGSLFKFHPDLKVIECKDLSLDEESRKILPIMYNLFSGQNLRGEEFKSNRINHIIDTAHALKDDKHINFDLIKDYINGLLDNLEKAEPFDVTSSEFLAIKAFGAFVKAPDSDIEKLLSVLVSNEIPDHRIALGLWGIIYGYSNFPHQYFREWVERADEKEIAEYLDIVNTQIYGNANPTKFRFLTQAAVSEPITNVRRSAEPDKVVASNSDIGDYADHIMEKVQEILNNCAPKKDSENYILHYKEEIQKLLTSPVNFNSIIKGIESIDGIIGKTAWGKAKSKIINAIKEFGVSNFPKNSFLKDNKLWENIISYLPNNSSFMHTFKSDLEYFIKEYFEGKQVKNSKNNEDVIKHFDKFLKHKIASSNSLFSYSRVYECFSYNAESKLIDHLKQLYPDD